MTPKTISIILFLLIFISNDTFFFGTNSNETVLSIPRYGAIILLVYVAYYKHNMKNYFKMFIPLILILSFYLFSSIHNNDTITYTAIYFIYILLAFIITTRIHIDTFWYYFDKYIYFLCCSGIICTIVAYTLPSIITLFPKVINSSDLSISNLFICGFETRSLNTSLIRCFSIFWEPGVFQIYVSLSLAYQLFIIRSQDIKRIMIYLFAIVITFSTAGYFVLAYIICIYFASNHNNKNYKLLSVAAIGILFLFTIGYEFIIESVFSKMKDGGTTTSIARYSSFYSSIRIALDNPFTGVGMGQMQDTMKEYGLEFFDLGTTFNTNGILYPLAAYGIPFGIIYMIGIFSFPIYYSNKFRISYTLFMLLLFFGERLMSPLPYILMFYGYRFIIESKVYNSKKESVCKLSIAKINKT